MGTKKLAVIGGGPVGLYTAIKLAKLGYRVDLFEKKSWPIDKVCGQGIMPSGKIELENIGLQFSNQDAHLFNSIEYHDDEINLKGFLNGTAIGVKRNTLSNKLFELASIQENLTLHPNTIIHEISEEYDNVFICDGLNSPMRKKLGLKKKRKGQLRLGARVHVNHPPPGNSVHVYWSEGIEAYLTPVTKHQCEIAFLWDEGLMAKGGNLKERLFFLFPELEYLMNYCQEDFQAYGPFNSYSTKIKSGRYFIMGDAYHFLDGITGEGISLGIKAAKVITENFEQFDYKAGMKVRLLYLNYIIWTKLALYLSRNPRFRKNVFRFISPFQNLFNFILKLNDFSPFHVYKG